jgi:hypothetical protein
MESILNQYEENKAEDFRDLSEMERKILVQRFIDQIIYDADKFKVAVKILENWEKNSNIVKEK